MLETYNLMKKQKNIWNKFYKIHQDT